MKIGFDNNKYLTMQSAHIRERIAQFDNKLYLEFGGKLFDDYHASRVLPGFEPDSKMRMLLQLKDQAEIVIAISAGDIEKNKVRGDLRHHLRYGRAAPHRRLPGYGAVLWAALCVTQYTGQPAADGFASQAGQPGHPGTTATTPSPVIPPTCSLYRQRRGLRQKRLHRDHSARWWS